MYLSESQRIHEHNISQARMELAELEAAKILAANNDFGCEIHIGGLKLGVSNNSRILPLIEAEITEISKFLNGEPNEWE